MRDFCENIADGKRDGKFFLTFPNQCLRLGLTGFYFAADKFPQ